MIQGPNTLIGGGFQLLFIFTSIWGKIAILTNIFQLGWNHHLANFRTLSAQIRKKKPQNLRMATVLFLVHGMVREYGSETS